MSGIYIKGMGMPKSCFECPCCNGENGFCQLRKEYVYVDVPRSCPLIPVPEHGRLGDLDALEAKCTDEKGSYFSYEAAIIGEAVSSAPTVIPADREGEGWTR